MFVIPKQALNFSKYSGGGGKQRNVAMLPREGLMKPNTTTSRTSKKWHRANDNNDTS